MRIEVAPLSVTLSDKIANFLLPVFMTFSSAGLEVFVSEGEMFPSGDTMIP